MAKELPYFKFEPNQWDNGNIQICTREDKGLFIDLCSMYWSRLGNVPLKLAVQKLCGGNASAFDSLINEGLFTVIDDDICIDFLNEQLSEFEDLSEQNRKNALEGWKKRRLNSKETKKTSERNASASNPQSETDAIREEKRKEDKRREDESILIFEGFWDRYDKKVDRASALKAFKKLKSKDLEEINNVLDDYVRAKPDKKFRPNFATFLNQERWKDEIINDRQNGNTKETGRQLIQQLSQTDAWKDA